MVSPSHFASPLADASLPVRHAPTGVIDQLLAGANGWTVALTVLIAIVIYDQFSYVYNKGSIVGPMLKIPILGPFLESVDPQFEKYKEKWASGPLSCVSVFHKFVVIASTRDMARKVFNSPMYVKPCVVDIAHKLLRPNNWVFLDGKAHVDYRKGLNGLFTRSALALYLPRQEEVYNTFFKLFPKLTEENGGKPQPWMPHFRLLITAVSCRTFVGYYISDDAIKNIADDYYKITAALELVNFPIIIPFTKTWYGKKASDMVLEEFAKCAAKSKARMAAGGDPTCILDAWVLQMIASEAYRKRIEAGENVPSEEKPDVVIRWFTDLEISMTLFTFLFASQDATTSACTWLFQLMADKPEMLNKIREENLRVRNGDRHKEATLEMLDQLKYTRAVIKETLRYRPPVLMVPYEVKKDFPVTDTYTVKKGSMIVPATYPALHDPEVYPDPETFNPDRWITGDADKQLKNWLVFGTGPHYCLGQTYAQNNLIFMVGKASMLLDWHHEVTKDSEVVKIFATIFPKDDCHLAFKERPVGEA